MTATEAGATHAHSYVPKTGTTFPATALTPVVISEPSAGLLPGRPPEP